jgi:hypothetical protein
MEQMLIPVAFKKLCRYFHQDIMLIYSSPKAAIEGAIVDALAAMTNEERVIVQDFVNELLNGRYTEEELETVWSRTPADFDFSGPGGMVTVLKLIRDLTDASLK